MVEEAVLLLSIHCGRQRKTHAAHVHFDPVFFNMYVEKHNSAVLLHVNMLCQYSSTLRIKHGPIKIEILLDICAADVITPAKRNPREIQSQNDGSSISPYRRTEKFLQAQF